MEESVRIKVPASRRCKLHFLPFLGEEVMVDGKPNGESQAFALPAFDRAAVAWLEDNQ
jgi:hypothetical protein